MKGKIAIVLFLAAGFILMAMPAKGVAGCPQGFEILFDQSLSMTKDWAESPCKAMSKVEAQQKLALKINRHIPGGCRYSAIRRYGYARNGSSTLAYDPAPYRRGAFGSAIKGLNREWGYTPLGPGIRACDQEMEAWKCQTKVIIIMSDFKSDPYFGYPVDEVQKLRAKYGCNLRVYTIGTTYNDTQKAYGMAIANAGGGHYWNACELLSCNGTFWQMMRTIFGAGCWGY